VTRHGYGKRTSVEEYRVQPEEGKPRSQSRGGKGRADIKTSARNGPSVAAIGVFDSDDVVLITKGGQLVRMAADSIRAIGRGTQGVRVIGLKAGDEVVAAARVEESDVETAAQTEATAEPGPETGQPDGTDTTAGPESDKTE
jgi:DNA gyrase subunit A